LNEVVITANTKEDKTATNNELAIVSARSFNVDDTKRYAGALGDPSRMAANYAGVVGGNDSRNDIVVRVYYQTLVVTAMTALAGNFLGGWLARRIPLATLLSAALAILAAGLAALPHVTSIAQVMLWATAMGLGGGLVMVLFFSVWARVYGRRHLGRIQGLGQAMTVLASALGPLLLAWWIDRTGSYAAMFRILAAVVGVTAVGALVTPMPGPATLPRRLSESATTP
jgi:MFS family permease